MVKEAKTMAKEKRNLDRPVQIEQYKAELIPEEFPEGPLGSPINKYEIPVGKSTPWKKGQRRASAFVYPDKEQHDDIPRRLPGSHPSHR